MIKQFEIPIPQARLDDIAARVKAYDWHEMPEIKPDADRWAYGSDMKYMKELCAYWLSDYRWQDTADELNRFQHFTARLKDIGASEEELDIHFIKEQGSGKNPRALLMTHGWPGSIYEFMQAIEPLAHPERFGGKEEDGITIICPSMPGYGFSSKPRAPLGPLATARLWDKLMREALGYESYIAQGGDWGSVITACLGLNHSHNKGGGCAAIHINMYGLRGGEKPETEEEIAWHQNAQSKMQQEGAYLQLQATKPQSLSYAMMDSPVGACAWIVEKFHGWSDITDNNIESRYTKHQLLSNVMIYLITRSFNTATWFYRGFFEEFPHIPEGETIAVPVGIGNFAEPYISFPPRRMIEQSYNVVHWQDYKQAGHFAAMEDAKQFVGEVQGFLRKL